MQHPAAATGADSHPADVAATSAPDDYVQTTEAARIVGVSAETIRAWHRSGKLSAAIVTSSGLRLFARAVVEQKRAERVTDIGGKEAAVDT